MRARAQKVTREGWLAVEAPILLLAVGTLVLRVRATEDLAENPLDPAGLFRLACVGAAGLLAFVSLLVPRPGSQSHGSLFRSPLFRIYLVYVFAVFLGAPLSEQPLLTAYRGVELTIAVLVFGAAYRRAGPAAARRIQSLLYWFAIAMLCSVWVGVVTTPSLAVREVSAGFENVTTPIPWQIEGVFPTISSNLVGALAALVGFWTIGRMIAEKDTFSPLLGRAVVVFSFITLIAAQYRTGYVAVLVAGFVAVVILKKKVVATLVVAIAIAAFVSGFASLAPAEDFVLKGQDVATTSATTLTGRLEWWEHALPVWRESPIIGKGLLTATRFEVLSALGVDTGSTIHSTWVEALLGTGVVGVALLLLYLVWTWALALSVASKNAGHAVPALLLSVITIRGLTGSSFEIFSYLGLVLFWIVMQLEGWRRPDAVADERRRPSVEMRPLTSPAP